MLNTRPILLIFATCLLTAPAMAQVRPLERRPCVAQDSPPNCDNTLKSAPQSMNSSGERLPESRRNTILRAPIMPRPLLDAPPKESEGTVTVRPTPPEDQPKAVTSRPSAD